MSECIADASHADVLEGLMRKRHSCREFLVEPVDEQIIVRILEMAQRTASWCNLQPWEVTLVTGNAIDRLRAEFVLKSSTGAIDTDIPFPLNYDGVYKERRRQCAQTLYESVGVTSGDREASAQQTAHNFRFFGAPHLAVISTARSLSTYGAVDTGGYIASFMLAAMSLGVASIAQAAVATQSELLHHRLGIKEDRLIVCGISFGYSNCEHAANSFRTTRAQIGEVVRWVRD